MAEPIQEIIARYQQAVRGVDAEAVARLVESYKRVYNEIHAKAEALVLEAVASKEPLSKAAIRKLDRYVQLQKTMRAELGRYGAVVDDVVGIAQSRGVEQGAEAAQQLMLDMFPAELRSSITPVLQRMPKEAVTALVGALQKESPLASITLAKWGERTSRIVSERLISGLTRGIGSRKTAREIMAALDDPLGMPLSKALTIARTETNRAFRSATKETYARNPHIVKGWIWGANINGDPTPCLACWAMHGTKHPVDEDLADHPNGRCTMLPITPTFREMGLDVDEPGQTVPTGEQEFGALPEARQREIMGETRYQAYRAGKFAFKDLATTRHSDEWGDTIAVAAISNN